MARTPYTGPDPQHQRAFRSAGSPTTEGEIEMKNQRQCGICQGHVAGRRPFDCPRCGRTFGRCCLGAQLGLCKSCFPEYLVEQVAEMIKRAPPVEPPPELLLELARRRGRRATHRGDSQVELLILDQLALRMHELLAAAVEASQTQSPDGWRELGDRIAGEALKGLEPPHRLTGPLGSLPQGVEFLWFLHARGGRRGQKYVKRLREEFPRRVKKRLQQQRPHRHRGATELATAMTLDLMQLIDAPLGQSFKSGKAMLTRRRGQHSPPQPIPGRRFIAKPDPDGRLLFLPTGNPIPLE